MIKLRIFPDAQDDFLIAYTFCEILNSKWSVEGCYSQSSLSFQPCSSLGLLDCKVPVNSASFWFGPENNISIDNFKNYGFVTSNLGKKSPDILSKMEKVYRFDDNFPWPYKSYEYYEKKDYLISYMIPLPNRMPIETIEACCLANLDCEIRILAPYMSVQALTDMITKARRKFASSTTFCVACPNSVSPIQVREEILAARGVIDFRNSPGASYAALVAHSAGLPLVATENCWPGSLNPVIRRSRIPVKDGGLLHGQEISEYSTEDLANAIITMRDTNPPKDTSKDILDLVYNIIVSKKKI